MSKPLRRAVSVVIQNEEGKTLFALHSAHKDPYPNTWSLPSYYMQPGEEPEDTARRIGTGKLGTVLEVGELLNEGTSEQEEFFRQMYVFRVTPFGEPKIITDDYSEFRFFWPEEHIATMPILGDCTRLYKEYLNKQ